jgi:AraC-like DNA-binding protein
LGGFSASWGGVNEERDERVELARAMREEGKTLKEIADALGYKSISSVHALLKE